ncbi:MAG: hypothetical protein ABI467_06470 [Kofleriaceae bacterium]
MRNFLKAFVVVSLLVPAVSFAGAAPKKATVTKTEAKTAPKTDAKTAKTDVKAKDTKVAPKAEKKAK